MNIGIISGSTRAGRLSHRIALALQQWLHENGHQGTIIDLQELNLPTFTGRLNEIADPDGKFAKAKDDMLSADGLIFLTPEYNGSISSSLKNFIDVYAKEPFDGKPIAVATGSLGALGGIRAAYQLQQIILSIFAYPMPTMLTVGSMDKVLNAEGAILDDNFQKRFIKFMENYVQFVKRFL